MLLCRMSKADFVAMSKSRSHESDLGNRSEHSLLSDSQTEVRLDPGQWRSVLRLARKIPFSILRIAEFFLSLHDIVIMQSSNNF
jgi:hypothetical protein